MITKEIKLRIIAEIKERKDNFGSANKLAKSLGISAAQLSRILKGETERVLSDAKFITIARKLNVILDKSKEWKVARTPVFEFINSQLEVCQAQSLSSLLCDNADIGKTFTAKHYVSTNKNSVYIDCSLVKTKQRLIRKIAQEFGLDNIGRYADVFEDLVFYLKSSPNPLIVLDEAGDLNYPAFLELKALWNATEHTCGWYMMGADGLRAKIERSINFKKVGYVELFSRFGSRFQKITPEGKEQRADFNKTQVAIIAKVNGASDVQKIYAQTNGSLRRVYTEIQKRKSIVNE